VAYVKESYEQEYAAWDEEEQEAFTEDATEMMFEELEQRWAEQADEARERVKEKPKGDLRRHKPLPPVPKQPP
jgi:hypothetical protein